MAARSSWKGYLKLSLVAIPVKAYNATSESSGIQLNQLHQECHSRIRYKKTCPIHGEVSNDEIVSGYEYSKDQYVVVDPAELEKLRPEGDKSIEIDRFFPADRLDTIYNAGRAYYLVPDGPVGQKPYALLRDAMNSEQCHAVAQVVISSREQLVRIRTLGKLITMTVLNHAADVKLPEAFQDEVIEPSASKKELELTRQLIHALSSDEIDIGDYHDTYTERLTQLIQARVDGKELVTPPMSAEPQVINLMEALKASVEQAAKSRPATPEKPPRRMAKAAVKGGAAKAKGGAKKTRKSG
jgi:DNA end-binding protein Ku